MKEDLVTVYRHKLLSDVETVKTLLEHNGRRCHIKGTDRMGPDIMFATGIELQVNAVDKLRAIKLIGKAALAANDYEKAARLRDEEKRLSKSMGIPDTNGDAPGIIMDKKALRKNTIALLLICSIFAFPIYELFVKKTMWCQWVGDVEVSTSDPLFWVYATVLISPVAVVIVMAYITFTNKKR